MNQKKKIFNIYKESIGKINKNFYLNIIKTKANNIKINFNNYKFDENKVKRKNDVYEEKGLFQFKYYNNLELEYINIFGEKFVNKNKNKFNL